MKESNSSKKNNAYSSKTSKSKSNILAIAVTIALIVITGLVAYKYLFSPGGLFNNDKITKFEKILNDNKIRVTTQSIIIGLAGAEKTVIFRPDEGAPFYVAKFDTKSEVYGDISKDNAISVVDSAMNTTYKDYNIKVNDGYVLYNYKDNNESAELEIIFESIK